MKSTLLRAIYRDAIAYFACILGKDIHTMDVYREKFIDMLLFRDYNR